ncbi:Permease of the drug/metabolite transporter (DMT) superfamily [Hyphomicrobiales bacterium]|nr:Permease of the drug/metabolite transporter (DMT) superfamily [Hyphomicrobiales bacterium]CAH1700383.1 Permease of the drug/metabolite transporter (DMT) superfamily [Hyphomicrobiales bacterium]CAI0344264.1 Membrane protein [Hyphomicrobiales bacterium]
MSSPVVLRAIPLVFTFLWSTGWVVAGYSARYADALTFLVVRFGSAAVIVTLLALVTGAPWPRDRRGLRDAAVSGILLHGIYLGGVWWAVRHGLPAGISGLIAGLQPVLTALFAPLMVGERISGIRWAGILCGFAGIALVLQPQLAGLEAAALWGILGPILINVAGMFSVTFGSFYQKAHVSGDLRTVTAIQYVAASLVLLPFAFVLEPMRIEWNLTMWLVLAWSSVVLSLGGIGLYFFMLRRGEVSRIVTFLYLVPALVAVEAWLLFGETLTPLQIAGMAVTIVGVALASRK